MRAQFFHTNVFHSYVEGGSQNIPLESQEHLKNRESYMKECLTVFFQVEKGDGEGQFDSLCNAIMKIAQEWGTKNLMLSGFAHLSNNHAEPQVAKEFYDKVIYFFKKRGGYDVGSSHFGYDKCLLLNVKGHPGSFKFRDFPPDKRNIGTKERMRSSSSVYFVKNDHLT